MNLILDALHVNKDALRDSMRKLRHVPLLGLAQLTYQAILFVVSMIGSNLGFGLSFLWGFVVYIVNIALMAHFLNLLNNVIHYDRLKPQDLTSQQFVRLIAPLMQAFFILYLVELVFSMVLSPMLPGMVSSLILLIWAGAKTPVNESVYLANRYGMDALMHTLDFWRDNWLQWLFPILAAFAYQLFVAPRLSGLFLFGIWAYPLIWLLSGIVISAWMIWRGELYETLNGTSLRSRAYRRKNNY